MSGTAVGAAPGATGTTLVGAAGSPTGPPGLTAAETTTLTPARDGRLVPYALVVMGGLTGAIVAGEPALVALAAPFLLALVLGLRRTGPVEVTARLLLDADQVLEGDTVTGRLELEWDGTFDAHLLLHDLRRIATAAPEALSRSVRSARSVELSIRVEASRWGRHRLGEVWLRLRPPLGLLSWTGKVLAGPPIRVLPGTERLDRLLDPQRSRAVWGVHRSTRLGDGYEFAELRPYAPGDRLRDLNWAATARLRRPFVNRRHPDLSGDVVIALDVFDDGSRGSVEAVGRAARVAWGLVSIHLRANDRVGLAGLGRSVQWLAPGSGRLARYRLLETLLRIGGEAADGIAGRSGERIALPPAALILALTPLHDRAILTTLAAWKASGRSVAAVVIDIADLLGEPASRSEALARRVWEVELEGRRQELARLGIPVVTAPAAGTVAPVLGALNRARRAPSVRRGGR